MSYNPAERPADIPTLINTIHKSLLRARKAPEQNRTPAVPIRQSVPPNYIVCLECGRRAKMLRKHLRDAHGLSADEYRAKWKLSPEEGADVQETYAPEICDARGAQRQP